MGGNPLLEYLPDVEEDEDEDELDPVINKESEVTDLLKKHFPDDSAVAGILGNMEVETGGSFDYEQKQVGGSGQGLIQMDGGMKDAYFNTYLKNNNKEDSAESQVLFIKDILNSGENYDIGAGHRKKLKEAFESKDPQRISDEFTNRVERPGVPHLERRKKATEKFYNKFKKAVGDGAALLNPLAVEEAHAGSFDNPLDEFLPDEQQSTEEASPLDQFLPGEEGGNPLDKFLEADEANPMVKKAIDTAKKTC